MAKVLVTPEAQQASTQLQAKVNELLGLINGINSQGQVLSDPMIWDGAYAAQFRSQWPEYHNAMLNIQQQIQELQQFANQVQANIEGAGGGY